MAARGRFIPRFPEKYIGDPSKIFFRSSWEIRAMKFWDSRSDVLRWNSEEIIIPFVSPKDNRIHQYFPDFYVEYIDRNGVIQKMIVEVKPEHEVNEKLAKYDRAKEAVIVNKAKWEAAAIYCATRGFKFEVITQKSLFIQKKKK